jgi:hypothetical protein
MHFGGAPLRVTDVGGVVRDLGMVERSFGIICDWKGWFFIGKAVSHEHSAISKDSLKLRV